MYSFNHVLYLNKKLESPPKLMGIKFLKDSAFGYKTASILEFLGLSFNFYLFWGLLFFFLAASSIAWLLPRWYETRLEKAREAVTSNSGFLERAFVEYIRTFVTYIFYEVAKITKLVGKSIRMCRESILEVRLEEHFEETWIKFAS